ncbi:MAG: hypothetical protein ABR976_13805 [Terracidiphilus sp.]|jgi:hypothetical protein
MKNIRSVFFVGLIALVGGMAMRAQQTAASPNLADTISWIQQNISLSYRWSYVWTQNSQNTPWLHKIVYERDDFGTAAPCHLTLVAHKQFMPDSINHQPSPPASSYDIDLSASTANSIQAVPFDLVGWASQIEGAQPANGDTITPTNTEPPPPSYWEIAGLSYDNSVDPILFTDQDMAQRVAKAFNHAVDLCGGKPAPKQPF